MAVALWAQGDHVCPACGATAAIGVACEQCGLQLELEACTVERWRGYVSSAFVARLADGTPVADSPEFRWRGRDVPTRDGVVAQAFDRLVAELHALGWEPSPSSDDGAWFEARFARVVAVEAPADVEEEAVEQPPPPPAPVREPVRLEPRPRLATVPVPAAEPRPAAPAAAEPPAPRRSRRARKMVMLPGIAALVPSVALGAVIALHGGQRTPQLVSAPAERVHTHVAAPVERVQTHIAAPVPAHRVWVDIVAVKRASWLELRRGTAKGKVIYSGELPPGVRLHLTGTRIWAQFGAAGNLRILVDGTPLRLIGTYEHVFAATSR